MIVSTKWEVERLRAIGWIVGEVLGKLTDAAKPEMTTGDLDRLTAKLLAEHQANATPRKVYNYPGHICISVNDEVVHGIPGERTLQPGDLIKLDLTADRDGFVADATRQIILDPAPEQAIRLADCARGAFEAALAMVRPGVFFRDIGACVEDYVGGWGFSVIRDLSGHGVGKSVHEEPEVPNFCNMSNRSKIKPGQVFTIEPIICAGRGKIKEGSDRWTLSTVDRSLAAHFEETIHVSDSGPEILTRI